MIGSKTIIRGILDNNLNYTFVNQNSIVDQLIKHFYLFIEAFKVGGYKNKSKNDGEILLWNIAQTK